MEAGENGKGGGDVFLNTLNPFIKREGIRSCLSH